MRLIECFVVATFEWDTTGSKAMILGDELFSEFGVFESLAYLVGLEIAV